MSAHCFKRYLPFLTIIGLFLFCVGIFSGAYASSATSAAAKKTDIVITIIQGKLVRLDPISGKKIGSIKSVKVGLNNRLVFVKTLRDDPTARLANFQMGSYLDDFLVDLPDLSEGGVWYDGDIDYPIGSTPEAWRVTAPCTVTFKIRHDTPEYLPMCEKIDTFISVSSNVKAPPYVYNPAEDTSYLWVEVRGRNADDCQSIKQALKSTYGDRVSCTYSFGDAAGIGVLPAVSVYGGMKDGHNLDSTNGIVTVEKAVAFIGGLLKEKDTICPPKPQAPEKIRSTVTVDRRELAEPIIAKLKQVFGDQMQIRVEVQASDNDTRHFPAITIDEPQSAYAYIDSKTEPLTPDKAVTFISEVIKKNGLFHPVFTDAKNK